jgi:RNA recognition motif-containing protein
MKIFVGNMSFGTDENTLRDLFSQHGEVDEVNIVTDRDSGRPRGFAFVTMRDDAQAQAAIEALNGRQIDGRALSVNEARPRPAGTGGRGGSGGGGRGGYGGGGGGGRGGYGDRGGYGGGGGGRSGGGGGRGRW